MGIRTAVPRLLLVAAVVLASGCKSRFTSAFPMEGTNCDDLFIVQDGGHHFGTYIVQLGGVRPESATHIPACPDDPATPADEASSSCVATQVPPGARTGPLTIRQNAGSAALIGMLDSDSFDLGEYTVTDPLRGPCNSWDHALADAIPAAACPVDVPEPSYSGDPAEDFTLLDQHGDRVELCQFYGRVVVLSFFTGWCSNCPTELATLEREFWQVYRDRGLEVVGVAIDGVTHGSDPTPEFLSAFGERYGITFPLLADTAGTVYDQYFLTGGGVPRVLVLDRELVVARLDQCNALAGGCSMDDLRAAIEELLGT